MGSFKEAIAPPPSPSPSSSSSSAPDDEGGVTSSSLPPLFWRSAPLLEVEPTIFRHLLYCCYTDQLLPYVIEAEAGEDGHCVASRDLVSLYAAADRFLLDHCKELVRDRLKLIINSSNVLVVFDHALEVAPDLANSDVFQSVICTNAAQLLGNTYSDAEAQWLALSTAGSEAVVKCNLTGLREVDLFRAVERWYQAQEDEPEQQSELKERLARVLKGVQFLLMGADEVRDVVEKSGLLSDKELLAVYRESALYNRMVLACPLPKAEGSEVTLFDRVTIQEGLMAWHAEIAAEEGEYVIYIYNEPQGNHSAPPSGRLTWAGISVQLYLDRRGYARTFDNADTWNVSGGYGAHMCKIPQLTPKHVLVLVHVPVFGLGPAPA